MPQLRVEGTAYPQPQPTYALDLELPPQHSALSAHACQPTADRRAARPATTNRAGANAEPRTWTGVVCGRSSDRKGSTAGSSASPAAAPVIKWQLQQDCVQQLVGQREQACKAGRTWMGWPAWSTGAPWRRWWRQRLRAEPAKPHDRRPRSELLDFPTIMMRCSETRRTSARRPTKPPLLQSRASLTRRYPNPGPIRTS